MMQIPEEKLEHALRELAEKQRACGVREPKRLMQQMQAYGALSALKEQFRRHQVSENFDELARKKLLALSPEALVVSKNFGALFTDEEADFCLEVLLDAGYYG